MKIPDEHKEYYEKDFVLSREISGEFNIDEIGIIEIYGQLLLALQQRKISPLNEDQKHFLEVVTNKQKPITDIEKCWLKFKKIATTPRPCSFCTGKGHYSDPITGEILTCEKCHGAGHAGYTRTQITVDES